MKITHFLLFSGEILAVRMSQNKVQTQDFVLNRQQFPAAAISVIFLSQCFVKRARAEVIELGILPPGRDPDVLARERLLGQLAGGATILSAKELNILPPQKVPAVQCRQTQKSCFRFGVTKAPQAIDALGLDHGNLAHSERIVAIMSRSSRTRLSLDVESAGAYILKPASAFACRAEPW